MFFRKKHGLFFLLPYVAKKEVMYNKVRNLEKA